MTENESMENFSELLDKSFKRLKINEKVSGRIVHLTDEGVYVNFEYKSEGFIPLEELSDNEYSSKELLNELKVGDSINAVVIRYENSEGNVLLSKKDYDAEEGIADISKAFKNDGILLIRINNAVKGGMVGTYKSLRIFIPISQLSDKFIKDTDEFLGRTIPVKIIEFDENRLNIVASARKVLEENKQRVSESFWDSIYLGKEFKNANVRKTSDLGLFIDIEGTNGLLHVSELPFSGADAIKNEFPEGTQLDVYIKDFDKNNHKVSLGLTNKPTGPWTNIEDRYKAGDVITAEITKFASFGVFVKLEQGIEGLVHISEISDKNVVKPSDILEIGEKIKCRILNISPKEKRLSLSIKDVSPINKKGESNTDIDMSITSHNEEIGATLGDLIKLKKNK